MIVRWQSDLVKTKESVLPVCSKLYYTNKRKVQKGEEIEVLQNCSFLPFLKIDTVLFLIITLITMSVSCMKYCCQCCTMLYHVPAVWLSATRSPRASCRTTRPLSCWRTTTSASRTSVTRSTGASSRNSNSTTISPAIPLLSLSLSLCLSLTFPVYFNVCIAL